MPYKDKGKKTRYMREYMRRRRLLDPPVRPRADADGNPIYEEATR